MGKPIETIEKYVRAANYLSAAQIFLRDNFLLERKLKFEDIKPRLLGHWGTSPGINFVYANLNHLIKKHQAEFLFVLGPGHGFAGLQANLFIEGTLAKYYPKASPNAKGIEYIVKNFSWPYGFPSHSNPGAPGVILEGGELGYALSTAYGAILDNPELIAACVVGDGEAETGPTATAWHLHRFVNPATNGAVLPILHLNGYKISGPTIFGRMPNKELLALFTGYGYDPIILEGEGIYEKAVRAFESCYQKIKEIQDKSRKGLKEVPRPPMIILKTLKGWTGIKKIKELKIEGNYPAHQVVATEAQTDREQLGAVEEWLKSYKFEQLFDPDTGFSDEIKELIPDGELKMGDNRHALGGSVMKPLVLPDTAKFSEDAKIPGTMGSSSMRRAGLYLDEVFKLNQDSRNFRFFSPDETYSNKLDAIFETTARAWMMPKESWDKDLAPDGRVIEMLSEHSLQGLMQGYILTGRHAIFASYEAFIQIITSMVDQYAKFIKVATAEVTWRPPVPSLNYILTSSGWRQEHNGFSHQNPGFITDMLQKPGCAVRVFFPPDGNSTLAVLKDCLESRNSINVIVAGKTLEPRWLTPELAKKEFDAGLMIWDFASENDPHIVFAGSGDYLTKEALAAIDIVKREAPEIRVRFVNILELSALGLGSGECRVPVNFDELFTHDKPVIFNFHGYPGALKQVLFDYGQDGRFRVHGYTENGSTTTPFDMQVRNGTSRWHLAIEAFQLMKERDFLDNQKADRLVKKYQEKFKEHRDYIKTHGVDPDDIENWTWKGIGRN
ncbi:phosphoketolase [candidate division WWE3 bacterium RIFCSPLOWO2_02_FULL_53_10]|uniref:Phosphoketolase n=1 Tax=candidate division WWE3 bacterium RIFCSPLOWO2_02_FULL_53_10 TaxID=1802629 RepID=A0A1F4WC97_UNCKA|nr:MAG: phosphoketolase [candidate division WWE3 bacterium RIFCSPLOWO2_02_FULL_53_10]